MVVAWLHCSVAHVVNKLRLRHGWKCEGVLLLLKFVHVSLVCSENNHGKIYFKQTRLSPVHRKYLYLQFFWSKRLNQVGRWSAVIKSSVVNPDRLKLWICHTGILFPVIFLNVKPCKTKLMTITENCLINGRVALRERTGFSLDEQEEVDRKSVV